MKPPALYDSDFQSIAAGNASSIFNDFHGRVLEEFVPYMNEILLGLQPLRAKFKDNDRTNLDAFSKKSERLRTGEKNWYTYNEGGRTEIQFHLGMTHEEFFIGLAFHMEEPRFGDPPKVKGMLEKFKTVALNDKTNFEKFVKKHKIELRWENKNDPPGFRRKKDILNFLEHPHPDLTWVFVGRILKREHNREILENPDKLDEVMKAILSGLWPYYERTQLSYHDPSILNPPRKVKKKKPPVI